MGGVHPRVLGHLGTLLGDVMTPIETQQKFRDAAISFALEARCSAASIMCNAHTLKTNRRRMTPSEIAADIEHIREQMQTLNAAFTELCVAASALTVTPGQAVKLVRAVQEEANG